MRRMVNSKITDSDMFIEMPGSSRLLYYDLLTRADDDGFITPKRIMRMTGAMDNDLDVLIAKQFLYKWEDGVVIVLHWREHNHVKSDRYVPSDYFPRLRELGKLYTLGARQDGSKLVPKRILAGSISVPQDRLGKDRVGEDSKDTNYVAEATEDIQKMKELWKEKTRTQLRNHLEENVRAYRYLIKEIGEELPFYLEAVCLIRADVYQKRTLQAKLINYAGLRERLEEVEAYMAGKIFTNLSNQPV